MIRKVQLTIPTPCHEDWNAMTPIEKGKFCGSCKKNVYDFTKSSDREILQKINHEENICGRFLTSQLDRDISIPKEKSSLWTAAASVAVTFLGLGNDEAKAQINLTSIQTNDPSGDFKGEIVRIDNKKISGVVYDATGPIPGANVILRGTSIGTQTNIDGYFELNVKEGDTVVFSYVGLKDVTQIIGVADYYKIKLEEDPNVRSEVVVAGAMGIIKRKPSETIQAGGVSITPGLKE